MSPNLEITRITMDFTAENQVSEPLFVPCNAQFAVELYAASTGTVVSIQRCDPATYPVDFITIGNPTDVLGAYKDWEPTGAYYRLFVDTGDYSSELTGTITRGMALSG